MNRSLQNVSANKFYRNLARSMEKFVSGTIKQAECGNPCSELGKELARCLK